MKPKKSPYILSQILTEDTKICRYMNFDIFLQLLNGKLYVPRRNKFLDARESGKLPLQYRFGFDIVGSKESLPIKEMSEKQQDVDQFVKNLNQSKYLLTSCWTIDNGEDYLMWKCYANDIGVCVRTTLGRLMEAIDYDNANYIPICSPMIYDTLGKKKDFLEAVFTKDKYYISENEVRLYFIPKTIININILNNDITSIDKVLLEASQIEQERHQTQHYKDFQIFEVEPTFINSIILSPIIKSSTVPYFKEILQEHFKEVFTNGSMIKQSQIQIK